MQTYQKACRGTTWYCGSFQYDGLQARHELSRKAQGRTS